MRHRYSINEWTSLRTNSLSQLCELGFVSLFTRLSSEMQEKDCYQEEVYKVLHCSADSVTDGSSMQKHLRNTRRWMSDF